MEIEVIKQGGAKEMFDESKVKLSIQKAAGDANIADDRVRELTDKILEKLRFFCKEKTEISSVEIREKILEYLDMEEPSISDAWRQFDDNK